MEAAHTRPDGHQTIVSHSFYIFLIRFFPALASLLVLVVFARTLPAGIYGRYQNFWIQLSVLNAVACLGLPAFMLTYSVPDLHYFMRVLGRSGIAMLTCWMLVGGLCFSALQRGSDLFPGWLPAAYLITMAGITILETYLIIGRHFRLLSWINIVYALGFGFLHWLALRHYISFPNLFLLLLAMSGCRILYLLPSVLALYRQTPRSAGIPAGAGQMSRLWLHLGAYDLSQIVFRWFDKFIVSLLLSPALSGLYFIGTIDVPFLPLLLGAVGGSLLLHMSGRQESDPERIRMMHYASSLLAQIVFPLFFFLLAFRYEIFSVVFAGKYNGATTLFFISLMIVPLRAYNFTALLQHKGAGALINKGAILDFGIALALMYPLYWWMGLPGIALSCVISTWFQSLYYLRQAARLTEHSMAALIPWRSWLKSLIIFSILFISLHYILSSCCNPIITLILGGSTFLVVMAKTVVPLLLSKRNLHGQDSRQEGI